MADGTAAGALDGVAPLSAPAPPAVRRAACALLGLLLAVAVGGRLVHLDADPHYYGWSGHLYDEGRWVEHARNLVQRGRPFERAPGPNLLVAPGFEAVSGVSFAIAGVGRVAARAFPALCGIGLVLGLAVFLWRRASPTAALLGTALVALQPDCVVLSRVAVPEMPVMALHLAAFAAIVGAPPRRGRLLLGGLLAAAAVGVKVTALPMLGILAAVAWTARDGRGALRDRLRDLGAFVAGGAIPGAPAAVVGVALLAPSLGDWIARLPELRQFVGVNDAYAILALPVEGAFAPLLDPVALAFWAAALAWLAAPGPSGELRRWGRGAAIWAGLYVGLMSVHVYFPERYMAHVFTPLALLAACAATHLERVGLEGLARGLAARRGLGRAAAFAVLAGPTAIWLAPFAAAGLGALAGHPVERVSWRLLTLVGVGLVSAWAAARTAARPAALATWLGLPLIATAFWSATWLFGETAPDFWLTAGSGAAVAGRSLLLAAAGGLSVLWAFGVPRSPLRAALPVLALGVVPSVAWTLHLAPGWLAPQHTVRDASLRVGALLADAGVVPQNRADGLFLDNGLAYRPLGIPEFEKDPPEWLLTALPFHGDPHFLAAHYEQVESFDLYAPALRSLPPAPDPACPGGTGLCVALYRLRAP